MESGELSSGSAGRWGPLFGARAGDWAETWEGPGGWGGLVYEHVLDRTAIGPRELGARLRVRGRSLPSAGHRSRGGGCRHRCRGGDGRDRRRAHAGGRPTSRRFGGPALGRRLVRCRDRFQFVSVRRGQGSGAGRGATGRAPTGRGRDPHACCRSGDHPGLPAALPAVPRRGAGGDEAERHVRPVRPWPTRRRACCGRPRAARRRRRPVPHRLQGRRYRNARLRRSGTDRTGDPTLGPEAVADALRHALVDFTDDDGAVRLRGWYRVAIADVCGGR